MFTPRIMTKIWCQINSFHLGSYTHGDKRLHKERRLKPSLRWSEGLSKNLASKSKQGSFAVSSSGSVSRGSSSCANYRLILPTIFGGIEQRHRWQDRNPPPPLLVTPQIRFTAHFTSTGAPRGVPQKGLQSCSPVQTCEGVPHCESAYISIFSRPTQREGCLRRDSQNASSFAGR